MLASPWVAQVLMLLSNNNNKLTSLHLTVARRLRPHVVPFCRRGRVGFVAAGYRSYAWACCKQAQAYRRCSQQGQQSRLCCVQERWRCLEPRRCGSRTLIGRLLQTRGQRLASGPSPSTVHAWLWAQASSQSRASSTILAFLGGVALPALVWLLTERYAAFISQSAELTGRRIATHVFGASGGQTLGIVLVLYCFGSCVGGLVVIKQLFPRVLRFCLGALLVLVPLSALPSMDRLNFTSMVSVALQCIIVSCVALAVVHAATGGGLSESSTRQLRPPQQCRSS